MLSNYYTASKVRAEVTLLVFFPCKHVLGELWRHTQFALNIFKKGANNNTFTKLHTDQGVLGNAS